VPTQDASGRWISDDGLFYWDGAAWKPLAPQGQPAAAAPSVVPTYGPPATPRGKSPWPAILIGCGIAAVVVIVLVVVGGILLVNNADFQRSFCNSYVNQNANLTCPFSPPSASP
jgi:hypothetical protein